MKKHKDKHLRREEILKAIANGVKPSSEHLRSCPGCLALYQTLLHFSGVADEVMQQPSDNLIDRLTAIPQLVGLRHAGAKVRGSLVFDSWRDIPATQLRDTVTARERRLRFSYRLITLELVAEWQDRGWEFTARVYDGDSITCKYVLKIGRERVAPSMHECYYFERPALPKTLQLLSPDLQISFDIPGPGSGGEK